MSRLLPQTSSTLCSAHRLTRCTVHTPQDRHTLQPEHGGAAGCGRGAGRAGAAVRCGREEPTRGALRGERRAARAGGRAVAGAAGPAVCARAASCGSPERAPRPLAAAGACGPRPAPCPDVDVESSPCGGTPCISAGGEQRCHVCAGRASLTPACWRGGLIGLGRRDAGRGTRRWRCCARRWRNATCACARARVSSWVRPRASGPRGEGRLSGPQDP